MPAYKIAIAGAGLAGLAAACFLKRQGHDVTVFERFTQPEPVGAGLLLQPTGLAALAELGLDDAMIASGAKIERLHGETVTGKKVFDIDYGDLAKHYFGVGIHRATLFNALYGMAQNLGVAFATGCTVSSSTLRDGKRDINGEGSYDLVIDASGYRSALRKQGEVLIDKPYPYGALWGVCRDDGNFLGGKSLQQRYKSAHVMIGVLPIGKKPGSDANHVAFFWSLPRDRHMEWREKGMEAWKAEVLSLWPDVKPFLDQFRTQSDLAFASYGDVVMKQWHGDKIAFIGDAGHSTSPQLGQGANMGFVDALTLSRALGEKPTIDEALESYSKQRKDHVRFYQRASRWLTPFFQSSCKKTGLCRDLTFGPAGKVPVVRKEMLRALAGIKTGLFSTLDPGKWNSKYKTRP